MIFLIPGVLENELCKQESSGNMGLYGVYLDIYMKRNMLYFGTGVSLLCLYFDMNLSYVIILFIANYVLTINKWKFLTSSA